MTFPIPFLLLLLLYLLTVEGKQSECLAQYQNPIWSVIKDSTLSSSTSSISTPVIVVPPSGIIMTSPTATSGNNSVTFQSKSSSVTTATTQSISTMSTSTSSSAIYNPTGRLLAVASVPPPSSCPLQPSNNDNAIIPIFDASFNSGIPSASYYPALDSTGTVASSVEIILDGDTSGEIYLVSASNSMSIFGSDGSSFVIDFTANTATYYAAGCTGQINIDLTNLPSNNPTRKRAPPHARRVKNDENDQRFNVAPSRVVRAATPPDAAFEVDLSLVNQCDLPAPLEEVELFCQLSYLVPGRSPISQVTSSSSNPYQDFQSQGDGTYIGYCGVPTLYYTINNGCNAVLNALRIICPTGRLSTIESVIIALGGPKVCTRIAAAAGGAAAETGIFAAAVGALVYQLCVDLLQLYGKYCTAGAITAEAGFCDTLATTAVGSASIVVSAQNLQGVINGIGGRVPLASVQLRNIVDVSLTASVQNSESCESFCPGLAEAYNACDLTYAKCLLGAATNSAAADVCYRAYENCGCNASNTIEIPCSSPAFIQPQDCDF